jgi:putative endonuclease
MTYARQKTGQQAEDLAATRLGANGWRILDRNARSRHGELDIVALDGRALVFVEVKAGRQNPDFGPERPILSVDRRKQLQVRRLATAWLAAHPDLPYFDTIRFDAIGITYTRGGQLVDFEHIEAAF